MPSSSNSYIHSFFMLWTLCIVESSMKSCYFFRCFPFDKSQFLLFPSTKQWIFKYKHLIVLFNFMKIIHVELSDEYFTCLTNEEKLECLKYLGNISLVKLTTSVTMNPTSSLSQHMIFLLSWFWMVVWVLLVFHKFSIGKMR
jgi:hypothetical protein